jgi:hypothetical protein
LSIVVSRYLYDVFGCHPEFLDGNLQHHLTTIDYRLLNLNPKLGLCHKYLPLEYKPPAPEVLVPEMADYVTQTSFSARTAIEAVDTLTLQIDHSMGADHAPFIK